jgi:hypothetical protein
MVSKAVEFAFDMAYQNRRTLDKLPFGGRQLQGVLDGWNRMAEGIPALKTIVPFANFMANSFTYTINRVGFGGAIKSGMSRLKLHSLLKAGVSDIDAQRAALREFNRYKEGLVETAGSSLSTVVHGFSITIMVVIHGIRSRCRIKNTISVLCSLYLVICCLSIQSLGKQTVNLKGIR